MHPTGHCTLLADCVSKLNGSEKARRKGATSQASLIYSERDIFYSFISTGITGKVAELFMQVLQDSPHYQGENKLIGNATSFGKFINFCTHFAPALVTQNSFPFCGRTYRHRAFLRSPSGILVTVFFSLDCRHSVPFRYSQASDRQDFRGA